VSVLKKIKTMENIKKILNAWWFNAAVWGGLGITILLYGYPLYAGACLGVGAKYFFDYFKK
jgi:hypothetical protein